MTLCEGEGAGEADADAAAAALVVIAAIAAIAMGLGLSSKWNCSCHRVVCTISNQFLPVQHFRGIAPVAQFTPRIGTTGTGHLDNYCIIIFAYAIDFCAQIENCFTFDVVVVLFVFVFVFVANARSANRTDKRRDARHNDN